MKQTIVILLLSIIFIGCNNKSSKNEGDEKFVENLLSQMTLEEKVMQISSVYLGKSPSGNWSDISDEEMKAYLSLGIGQLCQTGKRRTPGEIVEFNNKIQQFLVEKTRLGIPAIFHEEGLHGMIANDVTSFPTPIAMASSWNDSLVQKVYDKIGTELRSVGMTLTLSPVLDVAQEPRWGRFEETFGEDPYLVSKMGIASVKGFQGESDFPDNEHVIATGKHFVGYAVSSGGLNVGPTVLASDVFWNTHIRPFKEVIEEANLLGIMPSYSEVDGIPVHANKWLLNTVLREKLKFKGLVVADYGGVVEIAKRHNVAKDNDEAAILAFDAGVDFDLPNNTTYKNLPKLVKDKRISEAALDDKVRRVLLLKKKLGLFENPYANFENAKQVGNKLGEQLALEIAEQSIVLLKNDNNLLPLTDLKGTRIAVIGPNAANSIQGSYHGTPKYTVSILDGLKNTLGKENTIVYAKGAEITYMEIDSLKKAKVNKEDPDKYDVFKKYHLSTSEKDALLRKEAIELAKRSDYVVLCVGGNMKLTKESFPGKPLGDRADLSLTPSQKALLEELNLIGKPIITVMVHGGPIGDEDLVEKSDALLDFHYQGQEGGTAIVNILTGMVNPSAKMPYTTPRSVGQLPVYYNHKPSARRGYGYADNSPLFPFGYGLSYTTFTYDEAKLNSDVLKSDGDIELSITVTNSGNFDGYEVVQLYVRDDVSQISRPVKELIDFKKVWLNKGQSKSIKFTITEEKLKYYNQEREFVAEPGTFTLMIGSDSNDENLQKLSFEFKKM